MEIESLRLDFLTLIITKAQNNIRAYQRRKKKKKPEEPRPSRTTQAARGPGRLVTQAARGHGHTRDLGSTQPRPSLRNFHNFWLYYPFPLKGF